MTSGKRKSLFWAAVAAFFAVGAYLTLTGLGLGIDWRELRLVPTGSIYLRFSEKPDQVTLNGVERPHSGSWFESGFLFRSLLPETYLVTAEKEGYLSWSKSAPVPAGGVTARNNIRFFLNQPTSTLIATSTEKFWILGDELALKKSGTLEFRNTPIRGREITGQNPNNTEIITVDKNKKLFLINLDEPTTATNLELWFAGLTGAAKAGNPQKFYFHPFSPNKLIVETSQGVFVADEKKNSLEKISDLKVVASAVNDSGLIVTDKKNLAVIKFLFGSNWSVSTTLPLSELKASPTANLAAGLDEKSKLWLFRNSTSTPELIENNVQEFIWSPEGDRLLFLSRNLIHILFLDKWEEDFRKEAGDKLILAPENDGRLHQLNWLDNNHLIGLWNNELRVIEVDELLPLNGALLAKNIQTYQNFGSLVFYLSATGELRQMELE